MIANFFELVAKIKDYSQARNIPFHQIVWESTVNKLRYELSLDEQIQCGFFIEPVKSNHDLAIASRNQMNRILRELNRYPHDIIGDKALFRHYAKSVDALAPRTFVVFEYEEDSGQQHGLTEDDQFLLDKASWLQFLRANLEDEFIIKSAYGLAGQGLGVYRKAESGSYVCKEKSYTVEQIYQQVVEDKLYGKCVFQKIARNHPEIEQLTGSKTLQCLRIITLKPKNSGVVPYSAGFKISCRPQNDTDHFLLGATGNLYSTVNLERGQIRQAYDFDHKKKVFVPVDHHPFTGEKLKGWEIPHLHEAVDLAIKVHTGLASLRSIGWDIAITPEGPMVIEGNTLWAGGGRTTPYFAVQDMKAMLEILENHEETAQQKAA